MDSEDIASRKTGKSYYVPCMPADKRGVNIFLIIDFDGKKETFMDKPHEPLFEPTLESVKKHVVPRWYDDAKFGIFIHWSLASIPAFAPADNRDIVEIIRGKRLEGAV